ATEGRQNRNIYKKRFLFLKKTRHFVAEEITCKPRTGIREVLWRSVAVNVLQGIKVGKPWTRLQVSLCVGAVPLEADPECTECREAVADGSFLEEPQRSPPGLPPTPGEACGPACSSVPSLSPHGDPDLGETPREGQDARRASETWKRLRSKKCLKCKKCGKAFTRTSSFQRHMRGACGQRAHVCGACGKALGHEPGLGNMREHILGRSPADGGAVGAPSGITETGDHTRGPTRGASLSLSAQWERLHVFCKPSRTHGSHTRKQPCECQRCGKARTCPSHLETRRPMVGRDAMIVRSVDSLRTSVSISNGTRPCTVW
uniref:C2H2-type domain-containing protein n=1 Tax=Suricata suricatta TaxID=37032 RepID=A0A673U633_SURSU